MNPEIYTNSPLRKPRWRADRVMQMVEHQPSPLPSRYYDDTYVRTYRRFLVLLIAAGEDEVARFGVNRELPHVFQAHSLRFHSARYLRDVLDARLLTVEPLAEIANRFATEPLTIEFYEALFFNVRDRLSHKDWIGKVIRARSGDLSPIMSGATAEDQRGYLYRWIAYHGGPLALDALVGGLESRELPERAEDLAEWFDDALGQTLRARVVEVASVLEINQRNTPRLLKMALRAKRAKSADRTRTKSANSERDQQIEEIIATLNRSFPDLWMPADSGTDQPNSTPSLE